MSLIPGSISPVDISRGHQQRGARAALVRYADEHMVLLSHARKTTPAEGSAEGSESGDNGSRSAKTSRAGLRDASGTTGATDTTYCRG